MDDVTAIGDKRYPCPKCGEMLSIPVYATPLKRAAETYLKLHLGLTVLNDHFGKSHDE